MADQRDDDLGEIYARLTVHEFLIEVVLANICLTLDPEHAARFIADLRRVGKRPFGAIETSDEQLLALRHHTAASNRILDHLLDKVAQRHTAIRPEQ